ncbi:hypothetical protein [Neolewinella persica]|uniref:hypothetical protein n=1 Tax=Neolewinella persica TaxID=70998 RepID=UPI0003625DD7|nr:hypothetical protein [Neolewinella persica]
MLYRLPVLFLFLFLLFTSCINRGNYHYGGSFPNAQLPAIGKKIGVLDPRGPFGDVNARKTLHATFKRTFGKCEDTVVYTEDQLNQLAQLPAIYGDYLSDSNLDWFVEQTDLDYLILTDVGPGRLTDDPQPLNISTADREASVRVIVYDLADGGELKNITVTGRLNLDVDKQFWELEASEEGLGTFALKKAMKRLGKFTDCR